MAMTDHLASLCYLPRAGKFVIDAMADGVLDASQEVILGTNFVHGHDDSGRVAIVDLVEFIIPRRRCSRIHHSLATLRSNSSFIVDAAVEFNSSFIVDAAVEFIIHRQVEFVNTLWIW